MTSKVGSIEMFCEEGGGEGVGDGEGVETSDVEVLQVLEGGSGGVERKVVDGEEEEEVGWRELRKDSEDLSFTSSDLARIASWMAEEKLHNAKLPSVTCHLPHLPSVEQTIKLPKSHIDSKIFTI